MMPRTQLWSPKMGVVYIEYMFASAYRADNDTTIELVINNSIVGSMTLPAGGNVVQEMKLDSMVLTPGDAIHLHYYGGYPLYGSDHAVDGLDVQLWCRGSGGGGLTFPTENLDLWTITFGYGPLASDVLGAASDTYDPDVDLTIVSVHIDIDPVDVDTEVSIVYGEFFVTGGPITIPAGQSSVDVSTFEVVGDGYVLQAYIPTPVSPDRTNIRAVLTMLGVHADVVVDWPSA